jgi:hypothetical protein
VLLLVGRLPYDRAVARWLAGVPWHDLNKRYKRNYDAVVNYVLEELRQRGIDADVVRAEAARIHRALACLGLERLKAARK